MYRNIFSIVVHATLAVALSLSALYSTVHAAVPQSISYQAYVTDSLGAPLDGTLIVQFAIYDVETGGTPLWSDILNVDADNGLINVDLGRPGNGLPVNLFDLPVYLGITIEADAEMTPRQALSSAAYSFTAQNAERLEGQPAASLDQSGHVSNTDNPHMVTAAQVGAGTGDITAVLTDSTLSGGGTEGSVTLGVAFAAVGSSEILDGAIGAVDLAQNLIGPDQLSVDVNNTINGLVQTVADLTIRLDAAEATIAAQALRLDAVEANAALQLGPYVSTTNASLNGLAGPHVLLTGANLHVRSGSGTTSDNGGTPLGLGNLIVGYDAARVTGNDKTGSHNVVVGDRHKYVSYGGLLGGVENTTSAPWATAAGGEDNVAEGMAASVLGGRYITARADWATGVGGGGALPADGNTAHARFTTVVGGKENQAGNASDPDQGRGATAVGGEQNHALGNFSLSSGGEANIASGVYAATLGGNTNTAGGPLAVVSGGILNSATGSASSVSGGSRNMALGEWSSVSGGGGLSAADGNRAESRASSVSGGRNNRAGSSGDALGTKGASVSGGQDNLANGLYSSVSGGSGNSSFGEFGSVSGGISNQAGAALDPAGSRGATVSGGESNLAHAVTSSITGGRNNKVSAAWAVITGGGGPDVASGNAAGGLYSVITGGVANSTVGDWHASSGRELESRVAQEETGVQGLENVTSAPTPCADTSILFTATCPVGKRPTGGGCDTFSDNHEIWISIPYQDKYFCGFKCNGDISNTFATVVCADAPAAP